MSVSGIGSGAAKEYSALYYSNQVAASRHRAGEVKTSAKADSVVKTRQREQDVPVYSERASQSGSLPQQDSATTFPMPSIIAKYEKYTKAIDEHYAKVNEENKKFDNPSKHIWDKYYNTKSPYYVKGLTQREREICAESERRVLNGLPAAVNSYDPVIQKNFGGIMNDEEWNDKVRRGMNDSINRLFAENGIDIPEGADLRLRVDPYEYKTHAGGVDEALARQIEEVLNRGNNGRYLYEHLRWCNPANNGFEQPKQYLYDTAYQEKVVMWHFVNDMTGLDMRELENRDGVIYTPDGRNLWDVVTEQYNEKWANGEMDALPMESLYKDYQVFVKEGWDKEDGRGLTIGYKNGSLYDIDTEYGYGPGQREWLEDSRNRHSQYWENYRKEREETLRREKAEPTAFEKWLDGQMAYTEEVLSELGNRTYGKSGTLLSQPNLKAMQQLLDYAVSNGRVVPLMKEVLRLPGRETLRGGLDIKA